MTEEDGPEAVVGFLQADGIVTKGITEEVEPVPQAKRSRSGDGLHEEVTDTR